MQPGHHEPVFPVSVEVIIRTGLLRPENRNDDDQRQDVSDDDCGNAGKLNLATSNRTLLDNGFIITSS